MYPSRWSARAGPAVLLAAVASAAGAQQAATLSKPDAETRESFTLISSIRELPSGRVLVADRQDKVVQLVDLSAGTSTRVGREGQGPGEYGLPFTLLGLPNGETLLYDLLGRRFLILGLDGKPGGILEMPRPAGAAPGGPIAGLGLNNVRGIDGQGRIYFEGSPFTATGGTADSVPIYRWDRTRPVFDTIGWVAVPPGSAIASGGGNRVSVQIGGGKVWAPAETWDVAGDGRVARVISSPYRVIWLTGGSRAVAGPVQPYTPIRVTDADKALYLENRRKNRGNFAIVVGGGGGGGGGSRRGPPPGPPAQDPEFSETMPPFLGRGAVLATPDGEVWVLRSRPAGDKIPTYDVFDRTGALVKKVRLNPESRVVGFGKGAVYVARTDEDDLQYLERYRRP